MLRRASSVSAFVTNSVQPNQIRPLCVLSPATGVGNKAVKWPCTRPHDRSTAAMIKTHKRSTFFSYILYLLEYKNL